MAEQARIGGYIPASHLKEQATRTRTLSHFGTFPRLPQRFMRKSRSQK